MRRTEIVTDTITLVAGVGLISVGVWLYSESGREQKQPTMLPILSCALLPAANNLMYRCCCVATAAAVSATAAAYCCRFQLQTLCQLSRPLCRFLMTHRNVACGSSCRRRDHEEVRNGALAARRVHPDAEWAGHDRLGRRVAPAQDMRAVRAPPVPPINITAGVFGTRRCANFECPGGRAGSATPSFAVGRPAICYESSSFICSRSLDSCELTAAPWVRLKRRHVDRLDMVDRLFSCVTHSSIVGLLSSSVLLSVIFFLIAGGCLVAGDQLGGILEQNVSETDLETLGNKRPAIPLRVRRAIPSSRLGHRRLIAALRVFR